MENKFFTKRNIIIIDVVIIAIILAFVLKFGIEALIIKNELKEATHGITVNQNVHMYKSPKQAKKYESIEIGTDTYILKTVTDKQNKRWYKVKIADQVGYVMADNVKQYNAEYNKKDIMLDVSKFNMQNNFKTIGEFKAFILNNNVKFVYIRAGGRGYGKAGKFYTDPNADDFSNACEFIGVPFGYYFLEEAINSKEVDEEVEFIGQYLENRTYKNNVLPIALDVEKHSEPGRADKIWSTRAGLVNELIDKLESKGKKVILYSNANITNKYLENVNAKMWLAYYPPISKMPDYWYSDTDGDAALNKNIIKKMVGWQFTENGVKGTINLKVDVSLVYSRFFLYGEMQDIENDIKQTNELVFGPINNARKKLLNS